MANPPQIVSNFQEQVKKTLVLYDELVLAVYQKKKQKSLETMLAEQCTLSLAVLWEAFIHDLIVSYIEESPTSCIRFHKDRVTSSIESKSKLFSKWVTIEVPEILSRVQIEQLVDPNGWNITADSAETLAAKANQFLVAPHAKKFSLTEKDRRFIDLVIAIRNYLSHRSAGALTILKRRLVEIERADPTSLLNGTVTTVGAYLKAKQGNPGHNRAKLIGHQLDALAGKLV
jgi:hypothetical protein